MTRTYPSSNAASSLWHKCLVTKGRNPQPSGDLWFEWICNCQYYSKVIFTLNNSLSIISTLLVQKLGCPFSCYLLCFQSGNEFKAMQSRVCQFQCFRTGYSRLQKWPKFFTVLPSGDGAYLSTELVSGTCSGSQNTRVDNCRSKIVQVPSLGQKRPCSFHSCALKTQRLPWEKAQVSLLDADELANKYTPPQVTASQPQNRVTLLHMAVDHR